MAVLSSLTSSPIFRLSKTWALINKHHRATFDRLKTLTSEENNRNNLRRHMEGIRLPCIPYLGLYLGDLIFVDAAHPDTGGLESQDRTNKMNNILRILAEFQQSNYDHLREIPHIKTFLQSVKYIEELQKFVEEENYKRSLKIEPNPSSSTPGKGRGINTSREDLLHVTYDPTLPRRSMTPPTQQMFKPGHRKSQSLGRDARPRSEAAKIHKRRSFYGRMKSRDFSASCNGSPSPMQPRDPANPASDPSSGSLPRSANPTRSHLPLVMTTSLLDDSIISPGAPSSSLPSNSGSIGSSRSNSGSEVSDDTSWSAMSSTNGKLEFGRCIFESCLKRKSILKHGKKPPMSSWTKYWVRLCERQLIFYPAKTMRASDKHHFKQTPCKLVAIRDWMVLASDEAGKVDSFKLSNPNQGDIYRFQSDSKEINIVWIKRLQEAIKGESPMEKDLINLDDT